LSHRPGVAWRGACCSVVGVALGVSTLARAWRAPHWLESFGAWVSIGVLTLLALINIGAVLKTPRDQPPSGGRNADPRAGHFLRAAFASASLASISELTDRSSDERDRPDSS